MEIPPVQWIFVTNTILFSGSKFLGSKFPGSKFLGTKFLGSNDEGANLITFTNETTSLENLMKQVLDKEVIAYQRNFLVVHFEENKFV